MFTLMVVNQPLEHEVVCVFHIRYIYTLIRLPKPVCLCVRYIVTPDISSPQYFFLWHCPGFARALMWQLFQLSLRESGSRQGIFHHQGTDLRFQLAYWSQRTDEVPIGIHGAHGPAVKANYNPEKQNTQNDQISGSGHAHLFNYSNK